MRVDEQVYGVLTILTPLLQLSSDQLGQLYELLQATKQVWTDPKDLPQEDEEALERSALSELGLDADGKKEDK